MAAIGLSLFNFIIVLGPLVAIIAFYILFFGSGGIVSVVTPFFVIGKSIYGHIYMVRCIRKYTLVGIVCCYVLSLIIVRSGLKGYVYVMSYGTSK